jgi:hypothetical protein
MIRTESTVQTVPSPDYVANLLRRGKKLIRFALASFGLSLIFPVVASLIPAEQLPQWVGLLDVGVAITTMVFMLAVTAVADKKIADVDRQQAYQITLALSHLLLALLVIFFVAGGLIRWNVLLPGLAWRFWLLFYALPSIKAVWRLRASGQKVQS